MKSKPGMCLLLDGLAEQELRLQEGVGLQHGHIDDVDALLRSALGLLRPGDARKHLGPLQGVLGFRRDARDDASSEGVPARRESSR